MCATHCGSMQYRALALVLPSVFFYSEARRALTLASAHMGLSTASPASNRWGVSSLSSRMAREVTLRWMICGTHCSWRYLGGGEEEGGGAGEVGDGREEGRGGEDGSVFEQWNWRGGRRGERGRAR